MAGKDSSDLREVKRNTVFRLIMTGNDISRVELSRKMKLSKATVSSLVDDLITSGLIEEKSSGSSTLRGGKRPTILGLASGSAFIIGIWMRSLNITLKVLDLEGNSLFETSLKLEKNGDEQRLPEFLAEKIAALKAKLLKDFPNGRIIAVGIAGTGVIDPDSGKIIYSEVLGVRDFPLAGKLQTLCGLPVFLEDFSSGAARYEHWFGSAGNCKSFVFLQIFPCPRAYFFLDGRPYWGSNLMAGLFLDGLKFEIPGDLSSSFNLKKFEESMAKLSRQKLRNELNQVAVQVVEIIRNILFYYDPELIVLGFVPDSSQKLFLSLLKEHFPEKIPNFAIEKIKLSFASETPEGKETAMLCMVFDHLLKV
jgi:predicted NBD/HSP70 family sugar kinase